jgi:hypothetical protein
MIECEKEAAKWREKFNGEQDRTDEFFSKAEKYKLIAKDFRREIAALKQQLAQREQEAKNYELMLKIREENDDKEI